MKINQLKTGALLSYLQMFLSIVVSLVYTPVMLRILGQSEYGLYSTVASAISMLSVLNLGFNSSYIRYYSRYKKENNIDAVWKLNGLFIIVFSIIGVIAFICGMFLSFRLDLVFDTGFTVSEYKTARILMILLTINLAVSFPMSVFGNIISANERYVFLKSLGVMKTVLSPLVTLPLLLIGFRSIAMVMVTLIISLITDSLYLYYVLKVLKNKFVFCGFERGLFLSMFAYSSVIAVNMVVDQINWNIDKVLLGRFKGTTSVAVYSVGYAFYQYYMTFSTSVSSVFTPRVHRIINETRDNLALQRKQITELFVKVGRIQFILLGLLASGICLFGKQFIIQIWAGEGYENSYYVALLLILPATIAFVQNLGIEIQRAQNKHQFRSVVYAFMAVLNLLVSIVLCKLYGAVGSAVGTAISLVVANGFIMNIYYHKKCNIDIVKFWKSILKLSCGMIIPLIIGIVYRLVIVNDSIILFFAGIFSYTLLYGISMWFFGFNNYEKQLVEKSFTKILKKI